MKHYFDVSYFYTALALAKVVDRLLMLSETDTDLLVDCFGALMEVCLRLNELQEDSGDDDNDASETDDNDSDSEDEADDDDDEVTIFYHEDKVQLITLVGGIHVDL
jgi:hypothetical protein